MCEPAYLQWCRQHGVVLSGVAPGFVEQGWRGVIATRRLAAGDVIVRVPQALLMSVLSARAADAPLAAQLQQHQRQLSSHQVLTLHLLHEASKGGGSFWRPYIQQMPQAYTTLVAWPPAAVEALQLPHARDAAAAASHKARCEWQAARPVLHALGIDKKWASWRAWVWAASTVLSRTMYHPGDPGGCGCLTPLADLHNYAPPPPPFTPNLARDMQQLLGEALPAQQPSPAQQQQQPASQEQQQQQPEDSAPSASTDAPAGPGEAATRQTREGSTPGSPALPSSAAAEEDAVRSPQPQPLEAATSIAGAVEARASAEAPDEPADSADGDDAASQADGAAPAASISGDGHFAEGVYSIVARRSYERGEQVFLCYGRHTNLELLELYGFLLPDNPHDTAVLPLELLQQQLQHALDAQLPQQHCRQLSAARGKASGWRAVRVDVAPADCWVHPNGQPSWQLLCALRLAAATSAEAKGLGFKARAGQPISLASELLVLAALAGACRAQLAGLPTSAAQDEQRLLPRADCTETCAAGGEQLQEAARGGCCSNADVECEGLALAWRRGYQACLGECVHRCDEALRLRL